MINLTLAKNKNINKKTKQNKNIKNKNKKYKNNKTKQNKCLKDRLVLFCFVVFVFFVYVFYSRNLTVKNQNVSFFRGISIVLTSNLINVYQKPLLFK